MKKLSPEKAFKIYLRYLKDQGYKSNSINLKTSRVKIFFDFLKAQEIDDFRTIDRNTIKTFLKELDNRTSRTSDRVLKVRSRQGVFTDVKQLFKALYLEELILTNPVQNLHYKPAGAKGKKAVLSQEEMALFLDSIDEKTLLGIRDRAIFELMYSSGLRSGELCNINLGDFDFKNRMLLLREAKFGKDRVVPVSEVAVKFLKRYQRVRTLKREAFFLNQKGGRLTPEGINQAFKKRLKEADLYRPGLSSHSIRHSVAVHLLSNGADLRYVQELLGHDSIETTVAYTHDLDEKIRRIYKSHHPRENIYFIELDEAYINRLEKLKNRLLKAKANREKNRQAKKRYYEKNRKRILKALKDRQK